jgi:hypothetical protein
MSYKASLACAGAFAVAATLSGTAFAAEPAPLPPPVPIFTWSGLYVGGQIGYAWGRDPVTWSGISNDDELAAGTFSHTPQGVIGGAQVGYNLQYNQWLVLGLEGSVDGTSLSHTLAVPVNDVFGDTPGSITGRSEGNVQGSVRGRIGIAFDRALIYGTGGSPSPASTPPLSIRRASSLAFPEPMRPSRIPALGGLRVAASNMPSPTIGGCGPSTAIRISVTPRTFRSPVRCPSRTASFPCGIT